MGRDSLGIFTVQSAHGKPAAARTAFNVTHSAVSGIYMMLQRAFAGLRPFYALVRIIFADVHLLLKMNH